MKIHDREIHVEISGEVAIAAAPSDLVQTSEYHDELATLRFREKAGLPTGGVRGQIFPLVFSDAEFGTTIRGGIYAASRKGSLRGSVSTDYSDPCIEDEFHRGATLKSDAIAEVGVVADAALPIMESGFDMGVQWRAGMAYRQGTLIHGKEPLERNGCGGGAGQTFIGNSGWPSISPLSIDDILYRTPYDVQLGTMGVLSQISSPEFLGVRMFVRGGVELQVPAPGETGQISPALSAVGEMGLAF